MFYRTRSLDRIRTALHILVAAIQSTLMRLWLWFTGRWLRVRLTTARPEAGQGLVEYGLIIVLVAVVVIAILTILGTQVGEVFSEITEAMPD